MSLIMESKHQPRGLFNAKYEVKLQKASTWLSQLQQGEILNEVLFVIIGTGNEAEVIIWYSFVP